MINLESPQQLSCLLFGGKISEELLAPVVDQNGNPVIYKSGKQVGEIKLKKTKIDRKITGLALKPFNEWKSSKEGIFSTKEEVLSTLFTILKQSKKGKQHPAYIIINNLLELRHLTKLISTYYNSVEELIYDEDNCVHAQISHCGYGSGDKSLGGTETGRLSCTKPNIQNQPKNFNSNVKKHFTSRWGKEGILISMDYSQLEIVVQAQLSGDNQYIQDVIQGIDFHTKRLAIKENKEYNWVLNKVKIVKDPEWEEKRSIVKGFSFARAYGAGVKKIAQQTGMNENEVKQLMELEDLEYPQLKLYYDKLYTQVKASFNGEYGSYKGPTGREYRFYLQTYKNGDSSISLPQIKNYIVQGTATSDIVLIMLGKFWREAIKHKDKFLLINTVHDSVIIDCKKEYAEQATKLLQDIFTKVPEMMKEYFGYDWKVPIKVDMKQGDSWYEC